MMHASSNGEDRPRPADALAQAEAYGVDLSQLRERLKLTWTERWERHNTFNRLVSDVREDERASRSQPTFTGGDFGTLLKALHEAEASFAVVGGVAAAACGADMQGIVAKLELCYARERDNIERLARALRPLNPRLRGAPDGLPFTLDAATLRAGSNFTLVTEAGDLDLLGHVSGLGSYEEANARAETLDLYGHATRVLGLDGLIASKEAAAREKDERMLPELRALRALREERRAD